MCLQNLPCKVVDSLCGWCGWCEWCPCEWCFDVSSSSDWIVVESPGLKGRNRYDPCAFISFSFENTPFRTAVHTNTNNNSNAMILNTANIDDNFCLDRVVIVRSVIDYFLCRWIGSFSFFRRNIFRDIWFLFGFSSSAHTDTCTNSSIEIGSGILFCFRFF